MFVGRRQTGRLEKGQRSQRIDLRQQMPGQTLDQIEQGPAEEQNLCGVKIGGSEVIFPAAMISNPFHETQDKPTCAFLLLKTMKT